MIAPYEQAVKQVWQLLHSDGSMKTGSPGSIIKIAFVLHTDLASHGSQALQICQSTAGLFKFMPPPRVDLTVLPGRVRVEPFLPSGRVESGYHAGQDRQ